jgi:hypothetical protein
MKYLQTRYAFAEEMIMAAARVTPPGRDVICPTPMVTIVRAIRIPNTV